MPTVQVTGNARACRRGPDVLRGPANCVNTESAQPRRTPPPEFAPLYGSRPAGGAPSVPAALARPVIAAAAAAAVPRHAAAALAPRTLSHAPLGPGSILSTAG